MKKHVDVNRSSSMKKLVEEHSMKAPLIKRLTKNKFHISSSTIFKFFSTSNKFKKNDPTHVGFLEDLMLLMIKRFLPMKIVDPIWF